MTNTLKSFILFILSTLSCNTVLAQHENSFAGIRMGAALPMGEMASHEYGTGGYALLGTSVGCEAAWFVTPHLGLGVDLSRNSFRFASGFFADDYLENEPSFSSVELSSGPYKINTYMAGVYYKATILPRLSSTFKLMGGAFRAQTPDQFYGVNAFMVGKLTFWKTSSSNMKFTFLTGASLEYKVYEHVTVLLQADFTYAEAAFTFLKGSTSYTDYMQMPVFRLQPGINISF